MARGQHSSVTGDRESCRDHRPRRMEWVGWGFCSPAGGSPGHGLESKLPLQRDTHTPVPWERGTLSKHNCQMWFFLLSSWAWSISPFSNRYQQLSPTNSSSLCLQPLALPRMCSGSCRNDPGHNAHFLPPAGLKQSEPWPRAQDRGAGSNPPSGLNAAPGQLSKKPTLKALSGC